MEKIQDSLELGLCQVPCNKVNEEGAQGISEGDLGPGVKGGSCLIKTWPKMVEGVDLLEDPG